MPMKKVFDIIKTVFAWLIVVLAVGMMIFTIVSVNTFNRYERDVFGYKAFIVLSDSMKATDFAAGDLVITKNVDPTTLQAGDIIAYLSTNPDNYNEIVTHKIRTLVRTDSGDPGFITYGTTTDTDDEMVVTYPYVIGKYQFALPKVGLFFRFLRTTPGYITCILVPFIILIGMQGYSTIQVFMQYRKEQMEEMAAERAKIEAEREESQKMMAELLALKNQLQNGSAQPEAPPADPAQQIETPAPVEAPAKAETVDNKVTETPAQDASAKAPEAEPELQSQLDAMREERERIEREREETRRMMEELKALKASLSGEKKDGE